MNAAFGILIACALLSVGYSTPLSRKRREGDIVFLPIGSNGNQQPQQQYGSFGGQQSGPIRLPPPSQGGMQNGPITLPSPSQGGMQNGPILLSAPSSSSQQQFGAPQQSSNPEVQFFMNGPPSAAQSQSSGPILLPAPGSSNTGWSQSNAVQSSGPEIQFFPVGQPGVQSGAQQQSQWPQVVAAPQPSNQASQQPAAPAPAPKPQGPQILPRGPYVQKLQTQSSNSPSAPRLVPLANSARQQSQQPQQPQQPAAPVQQAQSSSSQSKVSPMNGWMQTFSRSSYSHTSYNTNNQAPVVISNQNGSKAQTAPQSAPVEQPKLQPLKQNQAAAASQKQGVQLVPLKTQPGNSASFVVNKQG